MKKFMVAEKGGGAKMINPINITICKIKNHKLFMLDEYTVDTQQDEYTGQEYVYCVRCKAYLPLYKLD